MVLVLRLRPLLNLGTGILAEGQEASYGTSCPPRSVLVVLEESSSLFGSYKFLRLIRVSFVLFGFLSGLGVAVSKLESPAAL